ncbi:hypothetical protein C8R43DRAFT_876763 [Mycena crocata]|nr:hypothetical protein C8R43DRAFT_876763 [Mycena crocata]
MRSLGPTRSVISGSVPVAAMGNMNFVPNDVDLYVPESQESAMTTVVHGMDFELDRSVTVRYPARLGIRRILWFVKGTFKMNIIVVIGENAAAAIPRFHSTVVMNFVSHFGFVCLYPNMTFECMGLINTNYLLDRAEMIRTMEHINRYRGRGFFFETEVRYNHLRTV